MKWAENEIREACRAQKWHPIHEETLIKELKKDHVHDWADDDVVTVQEIRETWRRWFRTPGHEHDVGCFLQDISERREPEYPPLTVWIDGNNNVWQAARTPRRWLKPGSSVEYPYDSPRKPLRQMKAV
jgi:hypothetical protein